MGSVIPWHSFFVHFSVSGGFIVPILSAFIWWKIKERDYQHPAWKWVLVSTGFYAGTLLLSLISGSFDLGLILATEELAYNYQRHQSLGYVLFGNSLLMIFIAYYALEPSRRRWRQGYVYFAFLNVITLMIVLFSGYELIYKYDFPRFFMEAQ